MPSGHVDKSKPKKPITAHTWSVLAAIERGPVPCYDVNPGVSHRLMREDLVEQVTWMGRESWRITDAGRAKLKERP